MILKNKLDVVYSSDDNYSQHMGVSIISLFKKNISFHDINVHIIENNISEKNKENIMNIAKMYCRQVYFYDISTMNPFLSCITSKSLTISSYARLFLSVVLPEDITKLLYLDCDTIINNDLNEFWNIDINNYLVAGVLDTVSNNTKFRIGLDRNSHYINAGVLLINLKKWRDTEIHKTFIEFIISKNGNVFHHDQGVINAVVKNDVLIVHPKHNVMTVFYTFKFNNMIDYYKMDTYYSEKEIYDSIKSPVIIHFTPAFVGRPWFKHNKHPEKNKYVKLILDSPWSNCSLIKNNARFLEKLIGWVYTYLPYRIVKIATEIFFGKGGRK